MKLFHPATALAMATAAVSALAADVGSAERTFTFTTREGALAIACGGEPVAEYVYRDDKILRPYFANLRLPGGLQLTRNHPPIPGQDATDHETMHPGVWLAFGDINGQDFWRNKGRIEHVRFSQPPQVKPQRLTFATECRLRAAEDQTIGSLTNRFTLVARTNGWLLVWEVTFRSEEGDLVFGDQEEMGFGVRVATAITEKNGGFITSSTGQRTADRTWGNAYDWCDYSGRVNGQPAGITLMSDAANFRPSWWHNRDYGLMVANPFGRQAMKQGAKSAITVEGGKSLRLRFGAAIHQGQAEAAQASYGAFQEEITREPSGPTASGSMPIRLK